MDISKEVSWEMAHRILGYQGRCGSLHGHSYRAQFVLRGEVDPMSGMVCDFGDLKRLAMEIVDRYFDHAVCLSVEDPLAQAVRPHTERVVFLDAPTTAENIAQLLFNLLSQKLESSVLGEGMSLALVRLWETPTSFVEVSSRRESVKIVFWSE